MNDVTFGQYYPRKSFVHSLDPRVKLLALIAFIVLLFCSFNFLSLILCAIVLFAAIGFAKLPLGSVFRSIKAVIFILVITAILNVLFHSGDHPLYEYGVIHITVEGIIFTVFLCLRLLFLVMASAVLTLTTTPVALADGIESLLGFLKVVHFPVRELALVISIALRFIPTLMDEVHRIINAQKARGADFDTGNIFKRIKALIPVLIPLLVSAFMRAADLADAMDARCYSGSDKRTRYKKLKFSWRDLVATIIFALLIAGVVLFNIYGSSIVPADIYQYIQVY